MSNITRVDLSNLPYPNVLQALDFEAELALCKADFLERYPAMAETINLESEPVVKLLETFAYRILLKTHEINSKAKALTLAYAVGSDLDHLAANRDVYRLLIQPANSNVVPPTEAIYESDDALRRRVQLAPERAAAGSTGAYQYWALSADGDVRDISLITNNAGQVEVWVQSHSSVIAPQALLNQVDAALDPETKRPATDEVLVKASEPFDFSINATLVLFSGPDSAVVLAESNKQLNKYLEQVSYNGFDVTRSGIYGALHQAGVQRVILDSPLQDIVIPNSRYGRCVSRNIQAAEFRDV
ncbi:MULTISPECIES: baseplate assembly protein [unclassified Acinetobacter]|uniref:baseplate assembly protein n=1 Tax=unclassified Acinetobacter TaxID=196816 RepID=UPI0022ABE080|nr:MULTISPECIES: baseplate J/gp47 family protein [unclassified Acinetobacter]WAU72952.1 baseplate J/gp47 family protein [Acinetobacter sp. TR11]WAU76047.1 baseplate J/gp47 family protein [Acinetobacter sp. TR3]